MTADVRTVVARWGLDAAIERVDDLVKYVGLAPSKEGLIGALREAGLS